MKHLNFLSKSSSQSCGHSSVTLASTVGSQEEFYVSGGNSRGAFTPADVCQTSSVRLNRFTAHRRWAMLKLISVLVLIFTLGIGQMWGNVITEGFETADAGNNYQGTVNIAANKSDCGISWQIYYGCASTSSKITGNNSAALRLYTTNNYGYLKTTTAITNLTQVSFKAKASTSNSAAIKLDVHYSSNGSDWTAMRLTSASGSNYINQSVSSSATTYTAYVPSGVTGDLYVKFSINSGSTKPNKIND